MPTCNIILMRHPLEDKMKDHVKFAKKDSANRMRLFCAVPLAVLISILLGVIIAILMELAKLG
jgi:hypothetical protein